MEDHQGLRLESGWPLFGLSVAHHGLLLREATDQDVLALAHVVEDGIVQPGNELFLPRLLLGRAATCEERLANFMTYHWARRSSTTPGNWDLAFAVLVEGNVVGCQSLRARDFQLLREVGTGSYLARHVQGCGLGTRMRALVLELSFGLLGAQWATSGFVEGNEPSQRLSARLGYENDGIELLGAPGASAPIKSYRLRLSREHWAGTRPPWLDEVSWSGVGTAKTFLGMDNLAL
jgi:RimJ/RimL family protein N-acetyltransferase